MNACMQPTGRGKEKKGIAKKKEGKYRKRNYQGKQAGSGMMTTRDIRRNKGKWKEEVYPTR